MGKSKKSRKRVTVGAIVVVLGALLIIYTTGIIQIPSASALSVARGIASISVSTTMIETPLLSEVGPSGTYKWRITATNTGTITWTKSTPRPSLEITTRLLKTTSVPEWGSAAWVVGNYLAGRCTVGWDNVGCRENIEQPAPTGWDMRYSTDNGATWKDITDLSMGDQVFSYNIYTNMPQGASESFLISLTIPSTASGTYPIISNAIAQVGAGETGETGVHYIIASEQKNLTVGTLPIGTLVIQAAGGILSIFGILLALGKTPF